AHRGPAARSTAGEPSSGQAVAGEQLYGEARGGTLTVRSAAGFENLDPGESYAFASDYAIDYATQRPLFSYMPNDPGQVVADLASEVPTTANGGISPDGRTVTVHIRRGVHFSPPVDREVTASDIAYAIERGANPNVANPYFATYFGWRADAPLEGAQTPGYAGGPIAGIQTPDKDTIVFHTIRPSGAFLVQALSLPLSAPVPQSFAGPLDEHHPTAYGRQYLVATGPYMIASNAAGMIAGIGYQAQPQIVGAIGHLTLVRNPSWNAGSDYRPAYLDRIEIAFGGDPAVIGRRVLTDTDAVQLDTPEPSVVQLAYNSYPSQLTLTPGAGEQFVALDNAAGPFTNEDLRKALWAALDRQAIVRARGGPSFAQAMTHFIYPGVAGFADAGGDAGPLADYNADPNGDPAVAAKYMKLAGYPRGTYTGSAVLRVVAASTGSQPAIAHIVTDALTALGFQTQLTLVKPGELYSKYCAVPRQEVDVCPSVGWRADFGDPATVLEPTFRGPATETSPNMNFGQVDDPEINAAIARATLVPDLAGRAQAWAAVDRLVVAKAVAVPETFNSQANIESSGVAGVNQMWNGGTWDFDFTSLK
ncbi:MAG: ABC transporter substrate-binding protein, partial [Solirubrobacteraceae bacterium]